MHIYNIKMREFILIILFLHSTLFSFFIYLQINSVHLIVPNLCRILQIPLYFSHCRLPLFYLNMCIFQIFLNTITFFQNHCDVIFLPNRVQMHNLILIKSAFVVFFMNVDFKYLMVFFASFFETHAHCLFSMSLNVFYSHV